MKKILYSQYGNLDELRLVEVEKPTVQDHTILVKVKAVSLNPLDWKIVEGQMKLMSGFRFPKGISIDFSGVVEEVGHSVKAFHQGDEVFGLLDVFKGGALAEYITVKEKDIALKPPSLSFAQASTLGVTGSAALQILDQLIHVKPGLEVLINGATGGIGMFLSQLAKQRGALVTSVVGTSGVGLAQKWKSDAVIDYHKQNVLSLDKKYDAVVDLSGKMGFASAKKIMKDSSVFVHTTPGPKEMMTSVFHNLFSSKKYRLLFLKPLPELLAALATKVDGQMDVVVDRTWPLDEFRQAYETVRKGGTLGKTVILL